MKKAQGLPITTIIIAILALVVLIILIAITTGRLQLFGKGASESTKAVVCPGIVTSITKCENPLIGDFVKSDGSKLGYDESCCEK